MDQLNPYETPTTFKLHRAEYLFGLAVVTGLMVWQITNIRWIPAVVLFVYIDLIGYIPGAIAYRRSPTGRIPKIYYVLYNTMHSMVTQGVVVGLYGLTIGWEWALLVVPFHLFGDRGLFGNFLKSYALPFEPVAQRAYRRLYQTVRAGRDTEWLHGHGDGADDEESAEVRAAIAAAG
jgi:hypothetical protein